MMFLSYSDAAVKAFCKKSGGEYPSAFLLFRKLLGVWDFLFVNAHQVGKFVINLCVVIEAAKFFLTCALCKYRYRQTGVCIGAKIDTGFVVEQVGDGNRQRLIAAVQNIFLLIVGVCFFTGQGFSYAVFSSPTS